MTSATRSRDLGPRRRAARPRVESLEARLPLATAKSLGGAVAEVDVVNRTLVVRGTAGPDRIRILPTEQLGTVRVVANGRTLGAFGPIDAIDVHAGAGNDVVRVDPRITLPARLNGGAGDDDLRGGSGPNAFSGGAGHDTLVVTPTRDTFDGGTGRTRTVALRSLGVIQVGPAAAGAGLRRLSVAYTLQPLQVAGPAVVGGADLRNTSTVALLKSSYDGGQTISLANATQADANALARLLGDPRPVDLSEDGGRVDLVSFRKVNDGTRTTYSVSIVLPVANVAQAPMQRQIGNAAIRRGDRAYLGRLYTPTPSLGATTTLGDPGDDLINLADRYFASKLYSDNQGDQSQLDATAYGARSFTNQEDLYYISQEIQSTSVSGIIGQVGIGGHVHYVYGTPPPLLKAAIITQPGPPNTGVVTQYSTSVNETFSGTVGWNQTSGFNASISGNVGLSNSTSTTVPPVSITYYPVLYAGALNWLFVSNNSLSSFTATDGWIFRIPFDSYQPGLTQLPMWVYGAVGPPTGPTTYQFTNLFTVPLPFGDDFQLQTPGVTGVSAPSVAPGDKFTINGTGFYPSLVEGVSIGGQPIGPAGFAVISDTQVEVVAPSTPGVALPVVVKTTQGLSNDNITINVGNASQVTVTAQGLAAVAGQAISNATVATITDSNPSANPAGFTATINWGDGTTSNGSILVTGPGSYNVAGTHTYATAGTYTYSVQVTDPAGSKAAGSATATVTPPSTTGGPQDLVSQPLSGVSNQAIVNATVATFTDADPNAAPTDFTASIDWGDGISTPITTVNEGNLLGSFTVLGTHLYNRAGQYTYRVTVVDTRGRKVSATGTATISLQ